MMRSFKHTYGFIFSALCCAAMAITSCNAFKPIDYGDPKVVADSAIAYIAVLNADALRKSIHPDNFRKLGEEEFQNIALSAHNVIRSAGTSTPVNVSTNTGEAYNLGGQVDITAFTYQFQKPPDSSDSGYPYITIAVAKGKVIGITVGK